jgi:hypothetical protein
MWKTYTQITQPDGQVEANLDGDVATGSGSMCQYRSTERRLLGKLLSRRTARI